MPQDRGTTKHKNVGNAPGPGRRAVPPGKRDCALPDACSVTEFAGLCTAPILLAMLCLSCVLTIVAPATARGAGASATPVSRPFGVPSTITIHQNALAREQAAMGRELRVASRCIQNARRNLRDTKGNIDRVAQTDLLSCGRRAKQLQRKLKSLARKAEALSMSATAKVAYLRRQQALADLMSRLQSASGN